MDEIYDVIIIGSGPAGLGAGVYCKRYKLKTLVIGKEPGGYLTKTHMIENYLGFPSILGAELAKKFQEHAEKVGVELKFFATVSNIKKNNDIFELRTESGETFKSYSVIVAIGTVQRRLNVPGEDKFLGKGVSYCATCDAPFFKGKTVCVVGGSDAAGVTALMLTEHAKKVYISYRREELRAEPITKERIEKNPKIEIIYKSNIKEFKGKDKLESIVIDIDGEIKEMPMDGVFIEIGSIPSTVLLKNLNVETNEQGYIKVKEDMSTNVEGLFAAGDISTGSNNFRQIITAAAEGAIASNSAFKYIKSTKG
ncbi:MAG: thioredoxin reductase [Candidatus Aenigmatarchaeota archaeon]|nr:MAG: thioredoxin reductase [Candidatus Aenigmarchaeota archaeon]